MYSGSVSTRGLIAADRRPPRTDAQVEIRPTLYSESASRSLASRSCLALLEHLAVGISLDEGLEFRDGFFGFRLVALPGSASV